MAASPIDERSKPSNGGFGCCNTSILAFPVGIVGGAIRLFMNWSTPHDSRFAMKGLEGFGYGFIGSILGIVLIAGVIAAFRNGKS
jgi:hypothetical protein